MSHVVPVNRRLEKTILRHQRTTLLVRGARDQVLVFQPLQILDA